MALIALTREQARRVDGLAMGEYGFSGLVLMENAGRGVADVICELGTQPSPPAPLPERERGDQAPAAVPERERGDIVVICCGKGNNAGDGFVIARHLDLRGYAVRVLLWAEPEELTGDAAANFSILKKTDVPIEVFGGAHDPARLAKLLEGAAWIVDALLGTGAHGEPRPPIDEVIDQINSATAPVLAVDLPSGLDCDTGRPARHTICAAVTCTFVAAKVGFAKPEAAPFVGSLRVLDIGVPWKLIKGFRDLGI